MALVGVELETLVSEPDALTTRPLSAKTSYNSNFFPKRSTSVHFVRTKNLHENINNLKIGIKTFNNLNY